MGAGRPRVARAPAGVALGTFLFRWRSYLPLAALPVLVLSIAVTQVPLSSHAVDLGWEALAVGVAGAGLALRVWTAGVASPGTSGRNTRAQKAAALNTTGPYSIVRHPLYLANGIIACGLALFSHSWLAPPLLGAVALVYYALIVRSEEAFLRQRFGARFEQWRARVPAVVPALRGYLPPERRFSWRSAVRREFYGLALLLTLPLAFDTAEDVVMGRPPDLDRVWLLSATLGTSAFLVLRYLKRRTTVLRDPLPAGAAPRAAVPRSALAAGGRAWRVLVAAGVLFAVLAGFGAAWGPLPGDREIRDVLIRAPAAVHAASRIANLAGTWKVMVPVAAFLLAAFGRARRHWRVWATVLLAAPVLAEVFKIIVARSRPESLANGFPSGHATAAAALFGAAWVVASPLRRGGRRAVRVVSVLVPGLVAAARVVLGRHWPSDVAGGICLGVALVALATWVTALAERTRSP
jgi:protein-S-isoprenylcysteine O-methyltransferase Ste14/membrane-associated phospholipid phosphatase